MRTKKTPINTCFQNVFSGPEGRRCLAYICNHAKILLPAKAIGDPTQTAYNEGGRDLALFIWKKAVGSLNIEKLQILHEQMMQNNQTTGDNNE